MKIALTYDLRNDPLYQKLSDEEAAEYDSIDTINAIDSSLKEMGFETVRIGHIQNLVRALAAGERWDLVFNIAEGRNGRCREAHIPALLDAYNIPYTFSDTLTLAVSMDKSLTKRIVQASGIKTAPFKVIEKKEDLLSVNLAYPLFAKPLLEGSSKGIHPQSCIHTPEELETVCLGLLDQFNQPVLVETFLPQREFTVGIVGTGSSAQVIGVMEIVSTIKSNVYTLATKKNYQNLVNYRVANDEEAQEAASAALAAYKALGCRDAARLDFRSDSNGVPQFMEINPLAGLHPVDSDLVILCRLLQIPYSTLIGCIVQSACKRIGITTQDNVQKLLKLLEQSQKDAPAFAD